MATLKGVIMPTRKRLDGTYNVYIRLTHHRESIRISTSIYVDACHVTRTNRIKDQRVIDAIDNIISEWRALIAEIGSAVDAMSAKELADYLKKRNKEAYGFRLDFIEYLRKVGASKRAKNTQANYDVVANTLQRFVNGDTLDIADVTASTLRNFERWALSNAISQGSIHLYMNIIKAAHNSAKIEYNDEDGGVIRVPQSPFNRYKIPTAPAPQPRGIDLATMQAIANMDDGERINSRIATGRDAFMLSFALGGMNGIDMYNLPYSAYKGDYIEYKRHKTASARADGATYRVHIAECTRPLVERLMDATKKRLFNFHLRFTEGAFLMTLPYAMVQIRNIIPYERTYTFYAARHTYASLARNIIGIDKYTVHELLNHSDNDMRITDRYIERDWQRLFDAHDKVVELIDWSKISKNKSEA